MGAVACWIALGGVRRIDEIDPCRYPRTEGGRVVVDARVEHGDGHALTAIAHLPSVGRTDRLLEDDWRQASGRGVSGTAATRAYLCIEMDPADRRIGSQRADLSWRKLGDAGAEQARAPNYMSATTAYSVFGTLGAVCAGLLRATVGGAFDDDRDPLRCSGGLESL